MELAPFEIMLRLLLLCKLGTTNPMSLKGWESTNKENKWSFFTFTQKGLHAPRYSEVKFPRLPLNL